MTDWTIPTSERMNQSYSYVSPSLILVSFWCNSINSKLLPSGYFMINFVFRLEPNAHYCKVSYSLRIRNLPFLMWRRSWSWADAPDHRTRLSTDTPDGPWGRTMRTIFGKMIDTLKTIALQVPARNRSSTWRAVARSRGSLVNLIF